MLANLLVIVFIVGMAYWWGLQGMFSAFLHLMLVIIAGAIALGMWEPFVQGFLIDRMPRFAWGAGLLVPFVLALVVLRVAMDKLVSMNLNFSNVANQIGGGLFGGLAGIVASGLTIIGLGFLPMGGAVAGYQPLSIEQGSGKIIESRGGLIVPVDQWTAALYRGLSSRPGMGAFATSTPMGEYQPDLARQALLGRLRPDQASAPSVIPDSISISDCYIYPTPLPNLDPKIVTALGERAVTPGNKFVIVDTQWKNVGGTFDVDGLVRVPPTQIRLVAQRYGHSELHAPAAYVDEADPKTRRRLFRPLSDETSMGVAGWNPTVFGWVFIVPENAQPRFMLVRNARLPVPTGDDVKTDPEVVRLAGFGAADGTLAAAPGDGQPPDNEPPDTTPLKVELTNKLPKIISRNYATAMTLKNNQILSGSASVKQIRTSPATQVIYVYAPTRQAIVRVQLSTTKAQDLFGKAGTAATMLQGIFLQDNFDQLWRPIGYDYLNSSNIQALAFDHTNPIKSARQLPIPQMNPGETLYLYYSVNRGVAIKKLLVGVDTEGSEKQTLLELDMDIPQAN